MNAILAIAVTAIKLAPVPKNKPARPGARR
jgi:hypothetical protein